MAKQLRILVTRLSALGDLVICTQYIAGLRRVFPEARITLLTGPVGAALFEDSPLIDEILLWHRKVSVIRDLLFLLSLRRHRFDYAFDLHSSLPTGLANLMVRAKHKAGAGQGVFAKALGLPHRRGPLSVTQMLAKAGYSLPLDRLGGVDNEAPRLAPRQEAVERITGLLTRHGITGGQKIALLAPGSSENWPSKRWPPAHFAALADWLVANKYQPIVIGDGAEIELGAEVILHSTGALDFTGQTSLADLIALSHRASITIANDSGPMHLSAAAGTATLALFGPTDGNRHGPVRFHGPRNRMLALEIGCAPCHSGICPLAHHHCMTHLSVEQVTGVVQLMLADIPDGL